MVRKAGGLEGTEQSVGAGGEEQKLGWEDARGLRGMWGGDTVKTWVKKSHPG